MCTVLHILACGKSGGIETLVSEYARESSHDNHFVFVWEDGYYEKKIREGGCSTYFLDAGKTGSFNATQELIKIVTNVKPDVIITHHGSPMIRVYVTLLSLLFHDIPVLMYVHCDAKDELNGNNRVARKVINFAAAKSSRKIIAISDYVKRSVVTNFKAKPEKIEQFAVGEYDMVIYDAKLNTCECYEIKHSSKIVPMQARFLVDEEKLNQTSQRFGQITKRCVLYRGEDSVMENGVEYQNVENYLKHL